MYSLYMLDSFGNQRFVFEGYTWSIFSCITMLQDHANRYEHWNVIYVIEEAGVGIVEVANIKKIPVPFPLQLHSPHTGNFVKTIN